MTLWWKILVNIPICEKGFQRKIKLEMPFMARWFQRQISSKISFNVGVFMDIDPKKMEILF